MDTLLDAILVVVLPGALLMARGCAPLHRQVSPAGAREAERGETVQAPSDTGPARHESLAESRYRGPIHYFFNTPRTHVLCVEQPRSRRPLEPGMALPGLRFFVYDLQADVISFEDALDNARVAWESDTSIKVLIMPGMVPDLEPREYGYRVDLVSGAREPL